MHVEGTEALGLLAGGLVLVIRVVLACRRIGAAAERYLVLNGQCLSPAEIDDRA
jgi:hypothetical protein